MTFAVQSHSEAHQGLLRSSAGNSQQEKLPNGSRVEGANGTLTGLAALRAPNNGQASEGSGRCKGCKFVCVQMELRVLVVY